MPDRPLGSIRILRESIQPLLASTTSAAIVDGDNEVQRVDVKSGPAKVSDKELQLASQLIDTLSGKFQPEKFHDEYQKNVEQLIEQKQKGERLRAPKYERPEPVAIILDALKKSLAQGKAAPKQTVRARSRKHKAA
jgi:DNA end-binding protein Ku